MIGLLGASLLTSAVTASRPRGTRAALVQLGVLVAIGAPSVCLEWGTSRALAAGATEDEITGALLATGPVAGLARVAGAVPDIAAALGYDVEGALFDPDSELRLLPRRRDPLADWTDVAQADRRKGAGHSSLLELGDLKVARPWPMSLRFLGRPIW